jgi:hypothetical protein
VAITGLGTVTPLGNDVSTTWSALLKGLSGVDRIRAFSTDDYPVKIAAEVKDFDPLTVLEKKEARRLCRFLHFAVAAAHEAVEDARLDTSHGLGDRAGVLVGSGIGGLDALEDNHSILLERGPRRVSPFLVPQMISNMASGVISMRLGARGPNLSSRWPDSPRCVRSRPGTTSPGGRAVLSIEDGTGSSWRRGRGWSCWSRSTTPWRAAPRFRRRSSATGVPPTRTT